jgi:hypothetical protein
MEKRSFRMGVDLKQLEQDLNNEFLGTDIYDNKAKFAPIALFWEEKKDEILKGILESNDPELNAKFFLEACKTFMDRFISVQKQEDGLRAKFYDKVSAVHGELISTILYKEERLSILRKHMSESDNFVSKVLIDKNIKFIGKLPNNEKLRYKFMLSQMHLLERMETQTNTANVIIEQTIKNISHIGTTDNANSFQNLMRRSNDT